MTDKTEAPERIALDWAEGAAVTSGPLFEARTRWVREDVAHAMVAAALTEAASIAHEADDCIMARNAIRALTPDDARAALDRLIAEAERRGEDREREACAQAAETRWMDWANAETHGKPEVACDVTACENIAAAIRARKTPPADD